jgi:hypothetical protein
MMLVKYVTAVVYSPPTPHPECSSHNLSNAVTLIYIENVFYFSKQTYLL